MSPNSILGLVLLAALSSAYHQRQSFSSYSEEYSRPKVAALEHRLKHLRRSQFAEGHDGEYTYKQVCLVNGKPQVLDGLDCRRQVAVARYKNSINSTGWSYLEVETKAGNDELLQAYAAGLLEGILSQRVIHYHITNTLDDYCTGFKEYCQRLKPYLTEHLSYVKSQLEKAPIDDPYWQSVKRTYTQLTGIWDGYRGVEPNFYIDISYKISPILMINSNGELYDLEKKFNKTKDPVRDGLNGKCSGLVKVAPENEDLFISQVTMSGYQNLLRVLKLYKFGYDQTLYPGHTYSFSSYPGMLYSSDDFALMSSGLASIETTISMFNQSLLDEIKPVGQLHCWVRAIAANQLARTGREWCQVFKRYNSGTYNNQWIILDYNKFKPKQPLPDYGLLYVLEQMPGTIVYRDLSTYLKKTSYFASYNIPFFKKISAMSGFNKKAEEMYWFSWFNCPRAKIFARDHSKVVDLDSLSKLMRYNDYTHEEFSKCDCVPPYTAEAAISARGDLNPANGTYPMPGMGHVNHGALDYKGTNHKLFKELKFRAWSGPTYDSVPVFKWSTTDLAKTVKHYGHPDEWSFKQVEYSWET